MLKSSLIVKHAVKFYEICDV